jgi:hypothetical protein
MVVTMGYDFVINFTYFKQIINNDVNSLRIFGVSRLILPTLEYLSYSKILNVLCHEFWGC